MQGRISWATLCALFLAAVFVAAIWTTIGFPLGTLGDEWAKIDAVRTGNNRYYHPLLMIEVTQFANLFAGARDLQSIVEVGRACAVVTANLAYDRFRSYAARKDWVSRPTGSYYRRLNALPHLDVSNGRPTLGYFNPVLRIVALDGNIERASADLGGDHDGGAGVQSQVDRPQA